MQIAPGQLIDNRFKILGPLGSGSFGAVYKAEQLNLERIVALKFVAMEPAINDECWKRLEREALVLSNLHHKGIVSLYAVGRFKHSLYMAMEYVTGKTLFQALGAGETFTLARVLNLAEQVCEALLHAHGHGIMHRDLKPPNIMLSQADSRTDVELVRVIDFGLAKLLPEFGKEVQRLTQTGATVGNVLYMSPEQCSAHADNRSDLYSLGAIMYHCISGRPPFSSTDNFSVMRAHLQEQAPPLEPREGDNPGQFTGLEKLIAKAMAKDPDDRYQSAQDMLYDLQLLKQGSTLSLPDIPAAYAHNKTSPEARGRSLRIAAVAALLLLTATVLFCIVATAYRQRPSADLAAIDMFWQWRKASTDVDDANSPDLSGEGKRKFFEKMYRQNALDHSLDPYPERIGTMIVQLSSAYFDENRLADGWAVLGCADSQQLPQSDTSVAGNLINAGYCAIRMRAKHPDGQTRSIADAIRAAISSSAKYWIKYREPDPNKSNRIAALLEVLIELDCQPQDKLKTLLEEDQQLLKGLSVADCPRLPTLWYILGTNGYHQTKDSLAERNCLDKASALIMAQPPNKQSSDLASQIALYYTEWRCWHRTIELLENRPYTNMLGLACLSYSYYQVERDADSIAIAKKMWSLKPTEAEKPGLPVMLSLYYLDLVRHGAVARATDLADKTWKVLHSDRIRKAPLGPPLEFAAQFAAMEKSFERHDYIICEKLAGEMLKAARANTPAHWSSGEIEQLYYRLGLSEFELKKFPESRQNLLAGIALTEKRPHMANDRLATSLETLAMLPQDSRSNKERKDWLTKAVSVRTGELECTYCDDRRARAEANLAVDRKLLSELH